MRARLRLDGLAVLPLLVMVAACQASAPRATAPQVASPRAVTPDPPDVEWRTYGGTYAGGRYSPLAQIDRDNVQRLQVAWRWRSPDHDVMARNSSIETYANEATPLMVGGVLYVSTSLSQVAAIDAATGQTLWVHDPEVWKLGTPPNHGWVHRGVAHWTDGREARIFIGTGNAFLIALDARTGQPIPSFGNGGRIDLTEGLGREVDRLWYSVTSPPVVVRDVVVVGASIFDYPMRPDMPPGHVRGFDARTGQARWTFHAIPQAGEAGNETWEGESWKITGSANVWAPMSADEDLGYVYLPFSTPANDYYGGHRHGDNLFGESLVCLDAATGRRVWHYQFVRHGVWDYDVPAAPNLADVNVDGRRVKAVAQVTKQAFVFVFDRVTGRPLWPIEERPVPQSKVPGEKTAATQPFPTRPAPVDQQGVRPEDVIDFTPELRRQALDILERYDWGPLYTPPSGRGTILVPGVAGGPSWSGAAVDRPPAGST
jgi:glucose dehydrogenase